MDFFKRIIDQHPALRKRIDYLKTVTIFGFDRVPVYKVLKFFVAETMHNSNLVNRAKAIAFSFFLAIFPFIIFLFTLIPYVPIEGLQQDLMDLIREVMPSQAAFSIIENTVEDIVNHQRGGLLSLGAVLTLYFSSNGVLAMMDSFDKSYSIYKQRNYIEKQLIAFYITLLLTGMLILSVVLIILGEDLLNLLLDFLKIRNSVTAVILNVLRYLIILALFLFSISLIYYYGPATRFKWRFISTGSTFATLLSILISGAFSYYVENFARYNEFYGSLGTIAIVLIWLYLNSYALLIGFELNASIYYHKTFDEIEAARERVNRVGDHVTDRPV
jgi:membrane protein